MLAVMRFLGGQRSCCFELCSRSECDLQQRVDGFCFSAGRVVRAAEHARLVQGGVRPRRHEALPCAPLHRGAAAEGTTSSRLTATVQVTGHLSVPNLDSTRSSGLLQQYQLLVGCLLLAVTANRAVVMERRSGTLRCTGKSVPVACLTCQNGLEMTPKICSMLQVPASPPITPHWAGHTPKVTCHQLLTSLQNECAGADGGADAHCAALGGARAQQPSEAARLCGDGRVAAACRT